MEGSMCFGVVSARHHPWVSVLFWQVLLLLIGPRILMLSDFIAIAMGYLLGLAIPKMRCCRRCLPRDSCLSKLFCCCVKSKRWIDGESSTPMIERLRDGVV